MIALNSFSRTGMYLPFINHKRLAVSLEGVLYTDQTGNLGKSAVPHSTALFERTCLNPPKFVGSQYQTQNQGAITKLTKNLMTLIPTAFLAKYEVLNKLQTCAV